MILTKIRENLYFLILITVGSFLCLHWARYVLEFVTSYRFLDLGHQLYNYELTFQGEIPYVDFWTNWWAPGSFYLNALAFNLFGTSMRAANLLLAIVIVTSTAALYCISTRIVPKPFAFAIALVSLLWGNFTLNFPYCGWYSSLFGLLAVAAFIRYLESPVKLFRLATAGFALGLTFSFKQHIGILNAVALAVATALSVCRDDTGVAVEESTGERNRNRSPSPCPLPPGEGQHECALSRWQRVGVREKTRQKSSPGWSLLICSCLLVLLPGHVLIPFFLFRTRYVSEAGIDAKTFSIFFLPVLVVNLLVLIILFRAMAPSRSHGDFRRLFRDLAVRELVLVSGFVVAVTPWYVYFCNLIGWQEFTTMILLLHSLQENFKQTYVEIMPEVKFPNQSIRFFFWTLLTCGTIVGLFIFSKSQRALRISTVASICVLVLMTLLTLPIGPELGRIVNFPSDFSRSDFGYCENPKLIGPLYYFSLLVCSILFVALLTKGRDMGAYLLDLRKGFIPFTLALFNIYNFMSLISFIDRAHLQMVLFPWLALVGYAAYLVYRWAAGLMVNPELAARRRKAGILVGVGLFFLVPYAGKPLFIYRLQRDSSDYVSMAYGKEPGALKKIRGDKGGVYINAAIRDQMKEIVEYIRANTNEDDYVFGAPCTTMFNFLADRKFPSKYSYLIFNSLAEEEKEELLEDLEETKPKLYIFDDFYEQEIPVPDPETEKFARDFPEIRQYISENYELEKEVGRFHLYRRK